MPRAKKSAPRSKQEALQLLDRELQRGRTKRFGGSRFRLGEVDLTRTDGVLTDAGKEYLKRHPDESLDHFDRATEHTAGSTVYARDSVGSRRVVGRMVDDALAPTQRGVAYFNSELPIFAAELPAWRLKSNGSYDRGTVTVTDQWLLELKDGGRLRASIVEAVGRTDPTTLADLIRVVIKEAVTQSAVPNSELGMSTVGLDLYD